MAKDAPIPVIFGEVLFDHFPDGSVVLGGAPFNVAWHLQAFRQTPLFVSRIGDDALGRTIRTAMLEWGMQTQGLQMDSAHPTGTVEVRIERGEPSYDIVAERAYDYIDRSMLPPVEKATVLYHGSLGVRNSASADALAALKEQQSAPVFLDVNLRPPWWQSDSVLALLRGADWVKLNEDELVRLIPGEQDTERRVAALFETSGVDRLFLTRGSRGALAYTRSGERAEIVPQGAVEVVDTVGAGDAFASVLLLGLTQAWPLEQILSRAQCFASAVVGQRGATVQDPGFYQGFIEDWRLAG